MKVKLSSAVQRADLTTIDQIEVLDYTWRQPVGREGEDLVMYMADEAPFCAKPQDIELDAHGCAKAHVFVHDRPNEIREVTFCFKIQRPLSADDVGSQ